MSPEEEHLSSANEVLLQRAGEYQARFIVLGQQLIDTCLGLGFGASSPREKVVSVGDATEEILTGYLGTRDQPGFMVHEWNGVNNPKLKSSSYRHVGAYFQCQIADKKLIDPRREFMLQTGDSLKQSINILLFQNSNPINSWELNPFLFVKKGLDSHFHKGTFDQDATLLGFGKDGSGCLGIVAAYYNHPYGIEVVLFPGQTSPTRTYLFKDDAPGRSPKPFFHLPRKIGQMVPRLENLVANPFPFLEATIAEVKQEISACQDRMTKAFPPNQT